MKCVYIVHAEITTRQSAYRGRNFELYNQTKSFTLRRKLETPEMHAQIIGRGVWRLITQSKRYLLFLLPNSPKPDVNVRPPPQTFQVPRCFAVIDRAPIRNSKPVKRVA